MVNNGESDTLDHMKKRPYGSLFHLGGAVDITFEIETHSQVSEVMYGLRHFSALLDGLFSPHQIYEVEYEYVL